MEDDALFASVMMEVLEGEGHQVTLCVSASEARGLIEASKYELLITDLLVYHDLRCYS